MGLSTGRRQAIIWTNAGKLLIQSLETNFSEIASEIHIFSFKKMHLKMPLVSPTEPGMFTKIYGHPDKSNQNRKNFRYQLFYVASNF